MSNHTHHTTPTKQRDRANFGPLGATPTRAGNNFVSSTNLGHTQHEIKSSLWGRILMNEPHFVEHLIKPHLVDDQLVVAIERVMGENAELKAARDLLFENAVPELRMYTPMVTLLHHISTFEAPPRGDAPSSDSTPTPESTPKANPSLTIPIIPGPSPAAAGSSARSSSPTIPEQKPVPSDDPEPLSFPDDGDSHALCVDRTWVDTHASLLRTDRGLYISVRGIKDVGDLDEKRPRDGTVQMTPSKVARVYLQADAATASHTISDSSESQHDTSEDAPTSDPHYIPNEDESGDDVPDGAIMDDRKPDISLIDLPCPDVDPPPEILWRQCALFMEMKKNVRDGPLGKDTLNARLPEGSAVANPRVYACKSIVTQMADNARILMATRPFLRFCLHIAFCGTNFNLALFDRNGAIISRSYNFKIHLGLFIRIVRRLTCEMTAYDLGLDTTVRLEGCLGSSKYPSYLVKVSDETWYRTEGIPLWQSTNLLGRGTLVFNARNHRESNGPLYVLKNAWREDGRLKESDLYELVQNSRGLFESPKALAKFVVGGDIHLHDGRLVTVGGHRARLGAAVLGNGATLHRLILARRGKSLASYTKFKHLLKAAWAIVSAHKCLNDQGILHGDISYGNVFLLESREEYIYGFLADLDLASIDDKALDKLPGDTANILRQQRGKGPRSGTVIFMAVELLRSQIRHSRDQSAARRRGEPAPRTLSRKREVHHDLEAFIWVLVYAMMIHNYNTLTHENDRKEYKATIDHHFGHGSAKIIIEKRQAMYMAHSRIGDNPVSEWFPDPKERDFFISCMTLIAEHDRGEERPVNWNMAELSEDKPPWDLADDATSADSHDEDTDSTSGTYSGKATKVVQKPVVGSRTSPPVITYQSVNSIIINSINGLR